VKLLRALPALQVDSMLACLAPPPLVPPPAHASSTLLRPLPAVLRRDCCCPGPWPGASRCARCSSAAESVRLPDALMLVGWPPWLLLTRRPSRPL
jgi:hypothetical protein